MKIEVFGYTQLWSEMIKDYSDSLLDKQTAAYESLVKTEKDPFKRATYESRLEALRIEAENRKKKAR